MGPALRSSNRKRRANGRERIGGVSKEQRWIRLETQFAKRRANHGQAQRPILVVLDWIDPVGQSPGPEGNETNFQAAHRVQRLSVWKRRFHRDSSRNRMRWPVEAGT